MPTSIALGGSHARAALWARLELSTVALMAAGVALAAAPLLATPPSAALEDALAATSNAFAAFVMGELLCMPFAAWFGETRSRRVARPIAAGLGLLCTIAGLGTRNPAARVVWYGLAGVGVEAAQAWMLGDAVTSPLLRRRTEIEALLGTCAVAVAAGVACYLAAAGPPQGVRTLVVCCLGQATVIVLAVLYALYPPAASDAPLA